MVELACLTCFTLLALPASVAEPQPRGIELMQNIPRLRRPAELLASAAKRHDFGIESRDSDGIESEAYETSTSALLQTFAATRTSKPHPKAGMPNATSCVTSKEARVIFWWEATSPAGTPCVFGVDVRDEGSHCVPEYQYGTSWGWCYTSADGSSWGSCAETCPLFGPHKVLSKKIDSVSKKVDTIIKQVKNLTDAAVTPEVDTSSSDPLANALNETASSETVSNQSTSPGNYLADALKEFAEEQVNETASSQIVSNQSSSSNQSAMVLMQMRTKNETLSGSASLNATEAIAEATVVPPNTTVSNISSATDATGVITCVTKEDPRATSMWFDTAPPGTPCMFGVDPRDEGKHCIPQFDWGSSGWCWTKADKTEWGSCNATCPLYGPHSVVGKKIDNVTDQLDVLMKQVADYAAVKAENADNVAPTASLSTTKTSRPTPRIPAKSDYLKRNKVPPTKIKEEYKVTPNDAEAVIPGEAKELLEKSAMVGKAPNVRAISRHRYYSKPQKVRNRRISRSASGTMLMQMSMNPAKEWQVPGGGGEDIDVTVVEPPECPLEVCTRTLSDSSM